MRPLIKPAKLNPGDKVAAVTLSWGGPGAFPYRFEVGKQRLESLFGIEVIPSQHALKSPEWIYSNPQARAQDLMEAFQDPSIKGIIATIGGDDSVRLLPYIDFDIIKMNPKVVLGYSDTTITHFMCLKAGLGSFYGPMVMTAFAENVAMHQHSLEGISRTLFSNEVVGPISQNIEGWTTEILEWENPDNQNIQRTLLPPVQWNIIGQCDTPSQGRLMGGCLEVLQFINGTTLWPTLSEWDETILFLEIAGEEEMNPVQVQRFFRNLAVQDILGRLKGILFSKPGGKDISPEQFPKYENAILKVFEEFNIPLIPIVTRMDFGHSDPMWTLPYGALTEINPLSKTVTILESAVV